MDETELERRLTAAVLGLSHARYQFLLVRSKLQDNTKGLTCIDVVRRVDAGCRDVRRDSGGFGGLDQSGWIRSRGPLTGKKLGPRIPAGGYSAKAQITPWA